MISQLVVQHDKNFNISIFSDTIDVINVKLCMMVLILSVPIHPTLSDCEFEVIAVSNGFSRKLYDFAGLFSTSSRS